MLISIATFLIIVWFVCLVTAYTLDGLIHVLLAVAIILILLQSIAGKSDSGDGI